jgi:RNA polymerase sigma-70 factor (ECF subfamily)
MTDETELIRRARQEPAAFGELYSAYVDRVYGYVYHRVGTPSDAEDLTARTFHRALASMPHYVDHGAPFGAFLFRIAHNLIANWHRDQARHPVVSLDGLQQALEVDGGAESAINHTAVAADLAALIRQLDAERQSLLVLKFSQGLSNSEIAQILGRSEGAVKSLYHRTLLELRAMLEAPTIADGREAASVGDAVSGFALD